MDTLWKRVTVPKVHTPGVPALVSFPSELKRSPFGETCRSQDTLMNCKRLVMTQNTGGSGEWLANAATGGASQANPDAVTWRVIARGRTTLSAGSSLEMRVLALPSGAAEEFALSLWNLKTTQATVRCTVDYERYSPPDTASKIASRLLPGSIEADGAENTDAGSAWGLLQHHYTSGIRPTDITPSGLASFSEWPTLTFTVAHRGGCRVVSLAMHETTADHVAEDTVTDGSTLHDYSIEVGKQHPDQYPQTETSDVGGTYEDHRFGTFHALHVAERQTIRLGPVIASWSSYAERTTEVDDTEADPRTITSTTFVGCSNANSSSAWRADGAGWDIPTHYCRPAPTNLDSRLAGNASAIPVRVWVYARFTTDAAGFIGTVRFASSSRSHVEVTIPEESTWAWYTRTGWIDGPVNQQDSYPVGQDFAKVTGGTMEIRAWSVHHGEYPVAT